MKNSKRLALAVCTFVFAASVSFGPTVAAAGLTPDDKESIVNYRTFYQDSPPVNSCSVTAPGTLPGGVPGPWNGIITAAATKFNANSSLLAAILYWENRGFPDPNQSWATSSAGAQGPMQFIPGTWAAYQEDGNGDGRKDVNNIHDAVFGAARLVAANGGKPDTPLGSTTTPLGPNTLLRVAASYNWGGGNVEGAGAGASLDDLPTETSDYVRAVYVLISSGFTDKPAAGGELSASGEDTSTASGESTNTCGNLGVGSGQFTDNTSITIKNAAQVLARAQEIANYSQAQLKAICDGDVACDGRCERLAAVVHGRASSGYVSAIAHWNDAKAKGRAHIGDRNVPIGALLYYDATSGNPYGHVAVYLGGNKVLSNDVLDSQTGKTGGAYITDAKDLEQGPWNQTYLGWVNPDPWI